MQLLWGLRLAGKFISPPISSTGQRLSSSASALVFFRRVPSRHSSQPD